MERARPHDEIRYVVLVPKALDARGRTALMQAGIPFIVPGKQVFMPDLYVDVRERATWRKGTEPKQLSWSVQVVLLRHLLFGDVAGRSLVEVAAACGYTPMTLTHAQRMLQEAGLAQLERAGRAKHLRFELEPRDLWTRAKPLLRNPIVSADWVRGPLESLGGLESGATALARCTELAPGPRPVRALVKPEARDALEDGAVQAVFGSAEADGVLEAWAYDPSVLSRAAAVDRLSLWLCFRDDPDERIQLALDELEEGVEW